MPKSKYETCVAPYLDRIKIWVAKGATQSEVASKLGISEAALYKWKSMHMEFREALDAPQGDIDDKVEAALYKRCIGYEYEEVTRWQSIGKGGELVWLEKRTKKQLPPEPSCIQFWLTNRRPSEWRRVPEVQEAEKADEHGVVMIPEVKDE